MITPTELQESELVRLALLAEAEGHWSDALACWEAVRQAYPSNPRGHRGYVTALSVLGRLDEADCVLSSLLSRFPGSQALWVEHARVPVRRNDWPVALERWQAVWGRFPDNPDAISGLGGVQQILGRFEEAEKLLLEGTIRFPNHHPIFIEFARIPHRRKEWLNAINRWNVVIDKFPSNAEAYVGASQALRAAGREPEVEELLSLAITRLPLDPRVAIEHARSAQLRHDYPEALRRWQALQERFTGNPAVLEGIRICRFHLDIEGLDGGAQARPQARLDGPKAAHPEETHETSRLMMSFESLGSGCEFGLVQRHFEAEPLGLLRWGSIPPHALANALHRRFQGVGEPEQVELYAPESAKEYYFRDTVYSLVMHTFIPVSRESHEKVLAQQCRRARFPKEKLLDDLDHPGETSKIFVYKRVSGSLSDEEIRTVYSAIRAYGDHTLLCMRVATPEHPNGTILVPDLGLMIGYISYLSATNFAPEIRYDCWMAICNKAWRVHLSLRSNSKFE